MFNEFLSCKIKKKLKLNTESNDKMFKRAYEIFNTLKPHR